MNAVREDLVSQGTTPGSERRAIAVALARP
jgi:hypothetical protein